MRRLVVVAFSAALLAVPVAQASDVPVLAIVDHSEYGQDGTLARFDSRSLQRLPGAVVKLGPFEDGWSFAPDADRLVLGFANPSCVGGETALRFVDTMRMRVLGDVPLLPNGVVEATAWLDSRHVLALVEASNCVDDTGTLLFGVDAVTRRITSRTTVPGDVVGVARAAGRLVLLVAPRGRIGGASLAIVDRAGRLRRVALDGLVAGSTLPAVIAGNSTAPHTSLPGLAVGGGDAFVVPAAGPIVELNLATGHASRHMVHESRSLAKGATGPLRTAVWIGNDRLAVTGLNFGLVAGRPQATPAGLALVDTRSWRSREIDDHVSSVQLAAGLLLASGRPEGGSVTAYSLSGQRRYQRGAAAFWFEGTLDGRGFAALGRRQLSFDLRTGKVGHAVPFFGQLILGASAPFAAGGF